jgi:aerobic carbon-monoxide dehydrogenase medium subunit
MYSFSYLRPTVLAQATSVAPAAFRFLAGGQSLVQAMKLRLSQPEALVDLGALQELRGISVTERGLRIGAMTTHAQVSESELVRSTIPALAELARGIGDPMVRNLGTIGGSIANADPAACYPAALLALDAVVITNRRQIAAQDFFVELYETALQEGELILAVEFSTPIEACYCKFKHPASRFAMVGVFVARATSGTRVAVTGARSSVYRESVLEDALSRSFSIASLAAIRLDSEGMSADIHCTAQYRSAMVLEMTHRAVASLLKSV